MFDFSDQTVLMIGGVSDLAAGVATVFKDAGAQLVVVHASDADREVLNVYPAAICLEASFNDPSELASRLAGCTFETVLVLSWMV